MNPYVSFGLAMCAIVFLALAATAYLAVVLLRRAKEDLKAALTPLASTIDGELDLDEAHVTGCYNEFPAEGRMTTSFAGPGRVFQTLIINGAGGTGWQWTLEKPRQPNEIATRTFVSDDPTLQTRIESMLDEIVTPFITGITWEQIDYDATTGHIRRTVPMQTRRDLPTADQFQQQLDMLIHVAEANQTVQNSDSPSSGATQSTISEQSS